MDDSSHEGAQKGKPVGAGGSQREGGTRFVELLGAHERSLFGYVFSLTGNWDDAQEVMQRLRIRLWEQFEQYDASRPFGPWARAIAYYLVLAFRKERSRQREYFCEHIIHLLDETYASESEEISTSRAVLMDCLSKLSKDQQRLVAECYTPGGPAALAASLGKTANAIRQAVLRVRRTLFDCVQRHRSAFH